MGITRRDFLKLGAAAVGAAACSAGVPGAVRAAPRRAQASSADNRPNIVFVLTDDQSLSTVGAFGDPGGPGMSGTRVVEGGQARPLMRRVLEESGDGWVNFRQAICTHGICAPSRATALTGQYSRHHGVQKNGWVARMDGGNTLAAWLSAAGYYCAFKGKYSYGRKDGMTPRPAGWDVWEPGGGLSDAVFPRLVNVIRAAPAGRPLFLCAWPVDPHRPSRPQPQYRDAVIELPPPGPATAESDYSDKPRKMRGNRPLTAKKLASVRKEQAEAARALLGVDDGIAALIAALKATGRWENTVLVFAGDHGYMFGEHGLSRSKDNPYRESVCYPFLMRDPALAGSGNRDETRMVGNIDIAPTLAAVAGVTPGVAVDGRSLLPLMRGEAPDWREEYLIEKPTATGKDKGTFRGVYSAVNGGPFTYVLHDTGEEELYDLAADPYQMESVHGRPEYAGPKDALRARVEVLAT